MRLGKSTSVLAALFPRPWHAQASTDDEPDRLHEALEWGLTAPETDLEQYPLRTDRTWLVNFDTPFLRVAQFSRAMKIQNTPAHRGRRLAQAGRPGAARLRPRARRRRRRHAAQHRLRGDPAPARGGRRVGDDPPHHGPVLRAPRPDRRATPAPPGSRAASRRSSPSGPSPPATRCA